MKYKPNIRFADSEHWTKKMKKRYYQNVSQHMNRTLVLIFESDPLLKTQRMSFPSSTLPPTRLPMLPHAQQHFHRCRTPSHQTIPLLHKPLSIIVFKSQVLIHYTSRRGRRRSLCCCCCCCCHLFCSATRRRPIAASFTHSPSRNSTPLARKYSPGHARGHCADGALCRRQRR